MGVFWLVVCLALYLVVSSPVWLVAWWATGSFWMAQIVAGAVMWTLGFHLAMRKHG